MKSLIVTVFLLISASVYAGNEMGNGTDNFNAESGSAWFLGKERSVKYCLKSSDKFGLKSAELEREIQKAIETWIIYINGRKINGPLVSESLYLTLDFKLTNVCDGKEDLTFLFGIETKEITEAKKLYENPTGLALRTSFDKANGWGKGIVWLSLPGIIERPSFPDWTKENVVQAFLLHELGHVFGVGHIQDTIMDSFLSHKIQWNQLPKNLKRSIDGKRDLLYCWSCPVNNQGIIGIGTGTNEDVRVFEQFFGQKPVGAISSYLKGNSLWNNLSLNIGDDTNSFSFPITIAPQGQGPIFNNGISIFKRVIESISTDLTNDGQVLFGTLTDKQNIKRNIILEINSSNESNIGPLTIKEIKNGAPYVIYRALPQQ